MLLTQIVKTKKQHFNTGSSVVEPDPPFLARAVKKGRLRLQLYSSSFSSDPMFKEKK